MYKNYWLGNNELVIIQQDGTNHVIEKFENWKAVFSGHIEQCLKYCWDRVIDYEESTIG